MDEGPRSIGAIARESGLSVSALRFYDSAGVLRASWVDPMTGYRWYTADQVSQARLIAALRRVSMPIPDICEVLASRQDSTAARRLLDRHQQALEDGLVDVRRHLTIARDLLDHQEKPMTTETTTKATVTTLTALGADLRDAINAVRFAVSKDAQLPALAGVLFDYDGSSLRLVATDRHRLAVAAVDIRDQDGPAVRVVVPAESLDDVALSPDVQVGIRLDSQTALIGDTRCAVIDAVFPDYQRLLQRVPAREVTVTTADLHHRLTIGPTRTLTQAPDNVPHEVSVVLMTDGEVEVIEQDHPDAVGFNREFLLQAIDAGDADQLLLALDGPITPLAIRDPEHPDHISLLMPTRLASSDRSKQPSGHQRA